MKWYERIDYWVENTMAGKALVFFILLAGFLAALYYER